MASLASTQLPTDRSGFLGAGAGRAIDRTGRDERQRTRWLAAVAGMVIPLALAACDGGDDGGSDPAPSFTEVHERVFQTSCVFSTCHKAGPSPAGELVLERDVAYANLVEVDSSVVAGRIRVVPGDPEQSYVIEKLTAAMPAAGDAMPPDAPLEAERIDLVRAWIEAGAADD
jgi:hypothetical protein